MPAGCDHELTAGQTCANLRYISTPAGGRELVTTARKKSPDLEKSLTQLEEIVQELEEGDLPLEQALKQFEKGVKLSRDCQTALRAAEQRVKILLEGELKDLEADPEDDA
jgi:exodeoxyribonuclease VII small subunit